MKKHDTIAYDLVAMLSDGAVSLGAEPLHISTQLNFNKINLRF